VLAHAATLSRLLEAELHVVHVNEAPRLLQNSEVRSRLAQHVALAEREILARIRRCLANSNVAATLHVLHGEPGEVLPQLAERLEAHTLVLGSLGRSGIEGLLIGDLAEELLMRVDCGVFCVKPAGFCTPVRPRSSRGASAGEVLL
jgi:nucleotide-binding universal stress UspA family protein